MSASIRAWASSRPDPTEPATVSAANFNAYGASTTPTLVLIDGKGIVRMYHPGAMSYPELAALVDAVVRR